MLWFNFWCVVNNKKETNFFLQNLFFFREVFTIQYLLVQASRLEVNVAGAKEVVMRLLIR